MDKRVLRVFIMLALLSLMLMPAQARILEHENSNQEKILITNVRLLPNSVGDYRMIVEVEKTRGGTLEDAQVVVFLAHAPWGVFFSDKKDLRGSETFHLFLDHRDLEAPRYDIRDDVLIVNVYGDGFKKTRVYPAKLFM